MSSQPRLVFAGTPDFAARPLAALIEAGVDIAAVYTQPDRPAGRGRKLTLSPVKQVALQHSIEVLQPASLRDDVAQQELRALQPDIFLVIAYGQILPQSVLDIPALGCINLHASLLPRWRGAAPIQRAIEAGDSHTGLCLMQMQAGLDTGPVLASAKMAIGDGMTAGQLHDDLAQLGAQQLPGWLQQYSADKLVPHVQDESLANYAHKLNKVESQLDWTRPASELALKIRAFDPWPGTAGQLNGKLVKLSDLQGLHAQAAGAPGDIVSVDDAGLRIACGEGSLTVAHVQFSGARRMSVAEAARGHDLLGQRFD